MPKDDRQKNPMPLQGEGAYDAARRFREAEERFVKSGEVERKAKEAEAAVEGAQGADLEAARHAAARGKTLKQKPRETGRPAR
ncbi:MAG TPA: hypothetical protein VMU93_08820 [Caulobacteraceae bacterium]|nr:hypothetical protein [Caulobacteraceae bacterium]